MTEIIDSTLDDKYKKSSSEEPLRTFPSLKLRDLLSAIKFFQPCCFPMYPTASTSRRNSIIPKSRSSSMVMYTTMRSGASGRLHRLRPVDEEVLNVFHPIEYELKSRIFYNNSIDSNIELNEQSINWEQEWKSNGGNFNLTVLSYKTQNVVGLNYFLKIRVDEGPSFLHARIYQPVDGTPFLIDITYNKTEMDDIEYF